ncbi:hypothetical protein D8674_004154 [Pyrus ussuriensis x Pyrus communis]|uniref:Uncharacterized protein n=1 Tax=Pyrus ussuriensis x Pyrus communis TaxID=2448454 RepID=A0A5N5FJ37_9ROSA|nr:hypothetical protein D8674_004154 [Pyrus ussuriensis x Pyrus communis]
MALGYGPNDAAGFRFFLILLVTYSLMAALVHSILTMRFIKPLEIDAPDRFSKARALKHVRVLTQEIDGRQVSSFFNALTAFFSPFCPN